MPIYIHQNAPTASHGAKNLDFLQAFLFVWE